MEGLYGDVHGSASARRLQADASGRPEQTGGPEAGSDRRHWDQARPSALSARVRAISSTE